MLRYNRDHESCIYLIFRELPATGLSRPEKSLPKNGNFYAT